MLNHRLGSMFYFCPSIKQANPSKSTMETPISMEVWIERWERQIGSGERTKRRIRNLCSSRILPISSSQKYTQQKPQALRSPTRKEWRKTLDLHIHSNVIWYLNLNEPYQYIPSSSSSPYVWNQGLIVTYWLAWELGSNNIGNWKMRVSCDFFPQQDAWDRAVYLPLVDFYGFSCG